jgi:hypothetical protein
VLRVRACRLPTKFAAAPGSSPAALAMSAEILILGETMTGRSAHALGAPEFWEVELDIDADSHSRARSRQARVRHQVLRILTAWAESRAAGLAMAFRLIESAQDRWRAVNAPHLVALVRAGATFTNGKLVERPGEKAAQENLIHRS